MATLDVLDYQLALDEALAAPGPDGAPLLEAGLRRPAVREARRTLDMMAFRFAVMDERALPEDLDYLRALEAVKPAPEAAKVLARRRPVYARARRRRRITTYGVLGMLALLIAGGYYVVTSEEAVDLTTLQATSGSVDASTSYNRTFIVTPEMTRLHIEGTFVVSRESSGIIEARLVAPDGKTAFYEAYGPRDGNFERANILSPQPGEWTLIVDFLAAKGSARVDITGVRPTR